MGRRLTSPDHPEIAEIHEALIGMVERANTLTFQADICLGSVAKLVAEAPEIRLTGTRAWLDRAEELRAVIADGARVARSLAIRLDGEEAIARGAVVELHSSSYLGRGMASDERGAMYSLRAKGLVRAIAEARSSADTITAAYRHIRDVVSSIEGHRIEALTLLRAGSRISADEYAAFRRSGDTGTLD